MKVIILDKTLARWSQILKKLILFKLLLYGSTEIRSFADYTGDFIPSSKGVMSRTKQNFLADWRLYILVADTVRLHVISRRPARSTTLRLPIYLFCDNSWVWLYAYVILRLSGEPAYKLSIPKRWDAVLFFFHVAGVDQSPTGGLWFFLTQFTLLPLEKSLPLPRKTTAVTSDK